MTREGTHPWRIAPLAIAIGLPLLALGLVAVKLVDGGEEPSAVEETTAAAPTRVASAPPSGGGAPDRDRATPSVALVEQCNRYAAEAQRDHARVLRDGVLGGALGAGVGAAGGAVADGGDGAGKGAGIGAIVGATAGALYGLNEENRRSEQAMAAYRECMARRGY